MIKSGLGSALTCYSLEEYASGEGQVAWDNINSFIGHFYFFFADPNGNPSDFLSLTGRCTTAGTHSAGGMISSEAAVEDDDGGTADEDDEDVADAADTAGAVGVEATDSEDVVLAATSESKGPAKYNC